MMKQVPEAVATEDGSVHPKAPASGKTLRFRYSQSMGVLVGMTVALLVSVLAFLRMRDVL